MQPKARGTRQPVEIDDFDVSFAPLDAADVVAEQAALEAKLLLRPAAASPQIPVRRPTMRFNWRASTPWHHTDSLYDALPTMRVIRGRFKVT